MKFWKNLALLKNPSRYSLRRAFAFANLIIFLLGLIFSIVVFNRYFHDREDYLAIRFSNHLESSATKIDEIFEMARLTTHGIARRVGDAILNSPRDFERRLELEAEVKLPINEALINLYFAFSPKYAERFSSSRSYIVGYARNNDLTDLPGFESPRIYRRLNYKNTPYPDDLNEVWYHLALQSQHAIRTPFYFDSSYMKRVMISITEAVRNPSNGEVIGVAGADLTAGRVSNLLASNTIGQTGGVFLIDEKGQVIAPFLGRDIPLLGFEFNSHLETSPNFSTSLPKAPLFNCKTIVQEIQGIDEQPYLYQARPLREPGYCVVAFQAKSETFSSLYKDLQWLVLITSFFIGLILLIRFGVEKYLITNIEEILRNISHNRDHFTRDTHSLSYRELYPQGPKEISELIRNLNLLYKRLERNFSDLRAERDRAELATRAKSRFLSVMSHEIRTPLNAMLGLTDVLLLSPLNPEQVKHLKVLQKSGESLLRILNDILDFSRLEAGKFTIENHEFDLYSLIHDIESLLRYEAESKGLTFRVVLPPTNYKLFGDSIRIRQVLLNLIGNAIKFTPSGRVELRVTKLQSAASNYERFQFEIIDTGIGISPEVQKQLFSEFAQADASITRRYGGTGLGLVISRRIVELLGGQLTCQSVPHQGSTFLFSLPFWVLGASHSLEKDQNHLSLSATQSPENRSRSTLPDTGPNPNDSQSLKAELESESNPSATVPVLIVDDDEDNHRLLSAYLRLRKEFHPIHAFSAKEALAKVRETPPKLVFMDMQMPEMDGIETTAAIRKLESEGTIPKCKIVMLSANTLEEDRNRSMASGADLHVAKPINLAQFHSLLDRWSFASH